jgi:hypothetical protein
LNERHGCTECQHKGRLEHFFGIGDLRQMERQVVLIELVGVKF